jgi:uncharacterized protein YcfJ
MTVHFDLLYFYRNQIHGEAVSTSIHPSITTGHLMKKIIALTVLLNLGHLASAQEIGRVISSVQVIQQVSVPRQVCAQEQVAVQPNKSGAGAAMGAIAGGAIGNQIGGGTGKAAATMLGIFGGAILGDKIEGAPAPQTQIVQNCTIQNIIENRVMGYKVTYEFNGKQYTAQLPHDPGPTIQLNITPAH